MEISTRKSSKRKNDRKLSLKRRFGDYSYKLPKGSKLYIISIFFIAT
jgi:hypothetical protein